MSKNETQQITCQLLLEKHGRTLQELAWKAFHENQFSCDEFLVYGIVVDSRWLRLVEHLCPNYDWQGHIDEKNNPIALGALPWERFYKFIPSLNKLIWLRMQTIPDGLAYCLILTGDEEMYRSIIPVSPYPTS